MSDLVNVGEIVEGKIDKVEGLRLLQHVVDGFLKPGKVRELVVGQTDGQRSLNLIERIDRFDLREHALSFARTRLILCQICGLASRKYVSS